MTGSTRSVTRKIDFAWILIPFTFACGIWELGGWAAIVWVPAVLSIGFIGSSVLMRLFGFLNTDLRVGSAELILSANNLVGSMVSGIAWGAAMMFAWPNSITGTLYLTVISVNFFLLIKSNH